MTDQEIKRYEELKKIAANFKSIDAYEDEFNELCDKDPPRISTGFWELDKALNGGLYNELYIFGAETSTGKSAFMMNLAENIAKSGSAIVIYHTIEMGKYEFVARGISRRSLIIHQEDGSRRLVTATEIQHRLCDEVSRKFVKLPRSEYSDYATQYFADVRGNLLIVERENGVVSAKDIEYFAMTIKEAHPDRQIVVFVDYLQILESDGADRKSKVDESVITLKTLASQVGVPVFVASSVGRATYHGTVSTASFKESGDTEYTGGVLLGWNWVGVTDQPDEEKRMQKQEDCLERGYRDMTLEVLKSRNAARGAKVNFKYFPAYNAFYGDDEMAPVLNPSAVPFNDEQDGADAIEC